MIWRVLPGDWHTDALIGFAFEDQPQDLSRFRNSPFWKERFGDITADKLRFHWTQFYEAIADKLLDFQKDRTSLVAGIHSIAKRVEGLSNLQDQFADGTIRPTKGYMPIYCNGYY